MSEGYRFCRFIGGPHNGEVVNVHDACGYFRFAKPPGPWQRPSAKLEYHQPETDDYKRAAADLFVFDDI